MLNEEIDALADRAEELARDARRLAAKEPEPLAEELAAVTGIDDPREAVKFVRSLSTAIREIRDALDLPSDTPPASVAARVEAVARTLRDETGEDSLDPSRIRAAIGEKVERADELEKRLGAIAEALGVEEGDDSAALHAIERLGDVRDESRTLIAALRPIFGHGLLADSEPEFLDVRGAMLHTDKAIESCGA
jgi:hypothetical protein